VYICNINYFALKRFIYIGIFCLCAFGVQAQDVRANLRTADSGIEGLSIFPNPATGDKVYITSKSGSDKEVVIFDVLGKKVLTAQLDGKELNIATLSPGVYIIKVREEENTATRKLIIK